MKRLIPLLICMSLTLVVCANPATVVAHATHYRQQTHGHLTSWAYRPGLNFVCYEDQCDKHFPHDTDGGSNCTRNGLYLLETTFIVDGSGTNHGDLDIYGSINGTTHCNALWATVILRDSYLTTFQTHTIRKGGYYGYGDDDPFNVYQGVFSWPNYQVNVYYDAPMLGWDDTIANGTIDCIYGYVHFTWQNGTLEGFTQSGYVQCNHGATSTPASATT